MKNTFGAIAAVATLCTVGFVAGCTQKAPAPKALPNPPSISSFEADKTKINPGDSVTLTYAVTDADTVEIVSQTGEKLVLTGDVTGGTATVKPLSTALYVLRVSGPGGRASAFVQVAVGEDLKDAFLVAVPPVIDSGDSAQLIWSAFHATTATIQSSLGDTLDIDVTKGSGVIDVTPARTTTYHLIATGANPKTVLDQAADIEVRPVLADFKISPSAAKVGEKLTITWTTRGANEVVLTEKTFGELAHPSLPEAEGDVDSGTFEWTIPDTLPTGAKVIEGQPLEFTLTVKQSEPNVTLTRTISSFVGDGPHIAAFNVPLAVTEGHSFEISWKTQNAERVQLYADGGLVYEPLPRDTAQIVNGRVVLKAPAKDATFKLVAYGHEGTQTQTEKVIKVVKIPTITEFNVPANVNAPGDAAAATWKTTDATRASVRLENGPTVFYLEDAAKVASGGTNLFPGVRSTYVFEAFNDAGDSVTMKKTIDVNTPGTFTATPKPVTAGDEVTVTWDVATATAGVVGDPTVTPQKNNPASDFYDLHNHVDAKVISFDDPNDGVAQLPVAPGFRFPFLGEIESSFFVSTNGFVTFANAGPRKDNVPLDDSGTVKNAPTMLAPFWDDLDLGAEGRVLYLYEGTSFPRRLIIQWDQVHTATDPASELTFEVQLWETGEVHFAWATMSGTDAGGENASIGWRLNSSLNSELATANAATVTSGDELIFFSGGAANGTYTVKPTHTSDFTIYAKRPTTNEYIVFPAHVNVIAPGSVLVNEAMVIPDAAATAGKWVELFNSTGEDLDLSGVTLESTANMASFTIPDGTTIAAGKFLVIGDSVDPAQNGGAPVTLEWTMGFAPSDSQDETLTLKASSPIDALSYTAASLQPKQSVQPAAAAIDSTGAQLTCTRSVTFGTNGAIGTPGAANESCFDYTLKTIPVDYEDISASGTPLFTPGSSMDQLVTTLDLSAQPFTYFKTAKSSAKLSSNGFIAFGNATSYYDGNKTTPSTSDPTGTLAAFWDDLEDNSTFPDANVYAQHIDAAPGFKGRWIIQWHHFTHYFGTDDLNFEVKLFDDGTIELHYAAMVSGSTSNYATGNNATEWIERPAGDAALPIGINQAVINPNTAYRFTPTP